MDSYQPAPASLKIVAALFIFGGICSAIEVIVSLMYGHININFGVLGLFIGPGLLRFSSGWRTCALVFLWIGFILTPIIALVFNGSPRATRLQRFWPEGGPCSQRIRPGDSRGSLLAGAVAVSRVDSSQDPGALWHRQ